MDELSLHETRVLGVLIEKEHTTPDNYPLSLNSLTSACNQKSSREPVLSLSQDDVQNIVDDLVKKRLVVNDEHGGKRSAQCNTYLRQACIHRTHYYYDQVQDQATIDATSADVYDFP